MFSVLVPFTLGVEEIELITIVDILRRANIEVVMASLNGSPVTGRSGITINAGKSLQDCMTKPWDMIVLPGGLPNADLLAQHPLVKSLATSMMNDNKPIAAICAAPLALAKFGLLKNKKTTSHPSVHKSIEQASPQAIYQKHSVVVDENIITSRGAGTALAFALTLVEVLTNKAIATEIKEAIVAA